MLIEKTFISQIQKKDWKMLIVAENRHIRAGSFSITVKRETTETLARAFHFKCLPKENVDRFSNPT